MAEFQNAIRINHRGFLLHSAKRFILTDNKDGSLDFFVVITDDVKEIIVYKGKLEKVCEEKTYYVGDFSEITREGDYHIIAGGYKSRQFVIYDGAYDICQRVMLEYFKYQRCGHPLGWHGECHLDDGYIKETGEKVDLSGGYHQSCDLRKSSGGVSIGVHAMLKYAIKENSPWSDILLSDEIKWACDYFVKTVQTTGAMYNTLNSPFGWTGREFYKSPAPSSAQWNVTAILALGSRYFKDKNHALSQKYLKTAILSYDYLMGENREKGVYSHPEKYPLGMDPDSFYDQCEINSTADICYQITVSAEMYRTTKDEKYADIINEKMPKLLERLKDGYVLTRKDNEKRIVTASCSYTWEMGGIFALCDGYEILGDKYELKEKIIHALDEILKFMDKSVWKTAQKIYPKEDLDIVDGHTNCTRRDEMGKLGKYKEYYYSENENFEPTYACYLGVFLARSSKLINEPKYMAYAQYLGDNLLGNNNLDSSRIRGIGYNNPQHHAFGQFFPSTPFIPGAVGVGYTDIDVYKNSSEYDMPCVGMAMYLLSEICK